MAKMERARAAFPSSRSPHRRDVGKRLLIERRLLHTCVRIGRHDFGPALARSDGFAQTFKKPILLTVKMSPEWYRQLFFGFRIGNTQVSFAVLLASTIVFGLAYAAARLFQGWLDARVLKPAGISHGVRDSIRIGVGYVGIVIAALAAISYAGFNLSSLAIVAGAFSVGIGFGACRP
jgi:small-conductance mechanosensitive channel